MRRLLVVAVCVFGLATTLAPVAAADPTNAQSSSATLIHVVCGSNTFTLAANGYGTWSPLHDTASTSIFNLTALDIRLTFTPVGGGTPIVDHAILTKEAQQDTITCTIPLQALPDVPGFTATIQGSGHRVLDAPVDPDREPRATSVDDVPSPTERPWRHGRVELDPPRPRHRGVHPLAERRAGRAARSVRAPRARSLTGGESRSPRCR